MYVCVCNSVTDGDIRDAVAEGVCSMEGLSTRLKVSSCCGRCSDCARRVLHQALTVTPPHNPAATQAVA